MAGRLAGKTALITGGTRGLGRAMAERFCAEGARVVVSGRQPLADPSLTAGGVIFTQADVGRGNDVTAMIGFALEALGRLDILVTNAGVEIEKTLEDTSEAEWDALMDVNLKGVFLCCKAAIPIMRGQGGGVIINLSSISARLADPNLAAYNASKAGVAGLTRSIAVDHGRDGIRCNAICPGWIMTDMLRQTFAQAGPDPAAIAAAEAAAAAQHPLGRLGRPEDIANLALWLASDEASFASGQLYTLDGGLTAGSPVDPGGQG